MWGVQCTLKYCFGPWNPIENVNVGLDIGLALFRRQAIAGTSDDIDHWRIYASPELHFYIGPICDSRIMSLYTCIYFIECFINVTLLSYMYIYAISVLIRNTYLLIALLNTTFTRVLKYICYCLTIVHALYLFIHLSNENIFRFTGPLWGESTSHRYVV